MLFPGRPGKPRETKYRCTLGYLDISTLCPSIESMNLGLPESIPGDKSPILPNRTAGKVSFMSYIPVRRLDTHIPTIILYSVIDREGSVGMKTPTTTNAIPKLLFFLPARLLAFSDITFEFIPGSVTYNAARHRRIIN